MAQTRSKTQAQTRSKAQEQTRNDFENNIIEDFEVSHISAFTDVFGNPAYYFTLHLGFISIYSMLLQYAKDGSAYITFPSRKGSDGNWYKTGYIENSALTESIIEEVLANV